MSFELNAQTRKLQGTGASRRLRHAGKVPGIVYGGTAQPTPVEVDHNELLLSLGNVISSTLIDLFQLGQSTWDEEGNQWIGHHERVMLAIEAGNGPDARQIMHAFLTESLDNAEVARGQQATAAE